MDEQTTPKKVRRVGSIALALVLIAAGVLLIVYQFVPQFDLLKILKFSPVILIALGIEMLVYSARPDVKVKFDWLAMLGTAFTLCIVGTAALLGGEATDGAGQRGAIAEFLDLYGRLSPEDKAALRDYMRKLLESGD